MIQLLPRMATILFQRMSKGGVETTRKEATWPGIAGAGLQRCLVKIRSGTLDNQKPRFICRPA
eukprot:9233486-Karenia_brevis.AAC.1